MMAEVELQLETFKVSVEEELEKYPELTKEMIEEMREWIKSQPHLPQSLPDIVLISQLVGSEFQIEDAKKALDVNYTIRTKADFFKNRDPCSEDIKSAFNECYHMIYVPDGDEEGNICVLARLADPDPAKYDYWASTRAGMMAIETALLEHGTAPGLIFISDTTGYSFSHMMKVPYSAHKLQMQYMLEGTPWKIKQMHVVNTKGSIIDKLMSFIKPFLPEKITQMMKFHQGYETLYDYGIKRSKMPEEYGGSAGTFAQMSDDIYTTMTKYKEYFKQEETQRVDESKREKKKYFGIF